MSTPSDCKGLVLCLLLVAAAAQRSSGQVVGELLVGDGSGGFSGDLDPQDEFGGALAVLGDLDGNGVVDLALGAPADDDGGSNRGAVWILFLDAQGGVLAQEKISDTAGGFSGVLDNQDAFGHALASLGDLDGDGLPELAVGAPHDDDGGSNHGAVWILFLTADGRVRSHSKISETSGGFQGDLDNQDEFGRALASLGDLDGDGLPELAVGAINDDVDDDGSPQQGAVWILFLAADGRVGSHEKISEGRGGFEGPLDTGDEFGRALAALGDLNGDGVVDLAVGASHDDDGGLDRGAVWLLFLAADGRVSGQAKLSATSGDFPAGLQDGDRLGRGLAALGDFDGDGLPDLAAGAPGGDEGGDERGKVWRLRLGVEGTVLGADLIAQGSGGFVGPLANGDRFGTALAVPGDLAGNGASELLVGAPAGDSISAGASWLLFFAGEEPPEPGDVFLPPANATLGRAGRPTLLAQVAGGEDFLDEPVVVVPNTTGNTLSVRQGEASPAGNEVVFVPAGEFGTGAGPKQVASGSFSNPGADLELLDLVVANEGGDSFSLLVALPDRTYAPHVEFSLLPHNSRPKTIAAADLDEDFRLDVVVGGAEGVSVFSGDGAGGFSLAAFVPLSNVTDLAVGELDGDGHLDVLAASGKVVTPSDPGELGFVAVLLGQGTGALVAAGTFAVGPAVASVLLADLAGDSAADALVAAHAADSGGAPQGSLALYLGDGAGGFSPSSWAGAIFPSAEGSHPTYGAVADLDADGLLDAVYTSSDNVALPPETFAEEQPPIVLTVLRNDGLGGLAVTSVGTAYTGKGVDPVLADVVPDGSGLLDAVLVWWSDGAAGLPGGTPDPSTYVSALAGDGQGEFFDAAGNQFATGDEPGDGVAVDTDGEGRADIAVPNLLDNSLTIHDGDGMGGVVTTTVRDVDDLDPQSLPAGSWVGGPRTLAMDALDGDGFLDAVTYNAWEDHSPVPSPLVFASFSVFLSSDGGVRSQNVDLPRGGEQALADVNGDGRPDVAVTQRLGPGGPDALRIHRGLLGGLFATVPLVVPAPASVLLSGGLEVADMDGDGDRDVVSTGVDGTGAGVLVLWRGTSSGPSVESWPVGTTWTEVRSLALADITGEGQLDVLVGIDDGRLALMAGQPGGSLLPHPLSAAAAARGGGAIAAGDLNGDGLLDIVSSTTAAPGAIDQAVVRTLVGQGGGLFSVQTEGGLAATGLLGPLRPLLAHFDDDGALDLILVHGTSDSVSVLLNQLSTFAAFGAGKPGSAGITPLLSGTGYTTPAGAVQLQVSGGLGGAFGLLFVGVGKIETGILHVEEIVLEFPLLLAGTPLSPGAGSTVLDALIPPGPALSGIEIVLQALFLDPGAGPPAPFDISASNGLSFVIVP